MMLLFQVDTVCNLYKVQFVQTLMRVHCTCINTLVK